MRLDYNGYTVPGTLLKVASVVLEYYQGTKVRSLVIQDKIRVLNKSKSRIKSFYQLIGK